MKKRPLPIYCILALLMTLFLPKPSVSQVTTFPDASRNGYRLPTNGPIRALVVYADCLFGSGDPSSSTWPASSLPIPAVRNYFLVDQLAQADGTKGFLTQYFNEASFGSLEFYGVHATNLITFSSSSASSFDVVSALNALPGPGIDVSGAGSGPWNTNTSIFDSWTFPAAGISGGIKTPYLADSKMDILIIVWRRNNSTPPGAGRADKYGLTNALKGLTGVNAIIEVGYQKINDPGLVRHELGHLLYGDNDFHTNMAQHGSHNNLGTVGGFSGMSNSGGYSEAYCGWDRDRLGWKNPAKTHYISALCTSTSTEVSTDFTYNAIDPCGLGGPVKLTLRNFVTSGDAVRIKLPYIDPGKQQQYLWLENHQNLPGTIDQTSFDNIDLLLPSGLYGYLQLGRDNLNSYSGSGGHIYTLSSQGNYDWDYETIWEINSSTGLLEETGKAKLFLDDSPPNPFTGYSWITRFPADHDGNGILAGPSGGYSVESFIPWELYEKDASGTYQPVLNYFSWNSNPHTGSIEESWDYNAFGRDKLYLASNPAPVPIYTHYRSTPNPLPTDNRHIYLNGISVKVVGKTAAGDLQIEIRWNERTIDQNVRWCGNIISQEDLLVGSGVTVDVDQSESVQKTGVIYDGFMQEPSIFTVKPLSSLTLDFNSTLNIKRGSTLHIQSGASLILKKGAVINVEDGAFICIEEGATVDLTHTSSIINISGSSGVNPLVSEPCPIGTCQPCGFIVYTGTGSINCFSCEFSFAFDYPGGYTVPAGSTVWTTSATVSGIIHVPNGAVLEIKGGAVIEFDGDPSGGISGIEIERGGKLILDNATLTGLDKCGELHWWKGVQVWGQSDGFTYSNDISRQGVLEMRNGAVIEHAVDAVKLFRFDHVLNKTFYDHSGGILDADGSFFRNNKRALEVLRFQSRNGDLNTPTHIRNCAFETTQELRDPGRVDACGNPYAAPYFVTIWGNLHTLFENNQFVNTHTFNEELRGGGVYAIDALLRFSGNIFEDLAYGISSKYTFQYPTQTSRITCGNLFKNLNQSVNIFGGQGHIISGNSFQDIKAKYTTVCSGGNITGLGAKLTDAINWQVTGNIFDDVTTGETIALDIGNSPAPGGLVYRNEIYSVRWGIAITGPNQNTQLKCNYASPPPNDPLYFQYVNPLGSLPDQGSCIGGGNSPAGNVFFNTIILGSHIFNSGTSAFVYNHHDEFSMPGAKPNLPPIGGVTAFDCGIVPDVNTCPNPDCDGYFPGGEGNKTGAQTENWAKWNNLTEALLESSFKLDQGQTRSLRMTVRNGESSAMDLLAKSPLTPGILLLYLKAGSDLSSEDFNALIKTNSPLIDREVIALIKAWKGSPQQLETLLKPSAPFNSFELEALLNSGVSDEFITSYLEEFGPYSASFLERVEAKVSAEQLGRVKVAQNRFLEDKPEVQLSPREKLSMDRAWIDGERVKVATQLISEGVKEAELSLLLESFQTFEGQLFKATILGQNQDFSQARDFLGKLKPIDQNEKGQLAWAEFQLKLKEQDKVAKDLQIGDMALAYELSRRKGPVQSMAQTFVNLFEGKEVNPLSHPILLPPDGYPSFLDQEQIRASSLKCYPNPSSEHCTFSFEGEVPEAAVILLFSQSGKEIMTEIPWGGNQKTVRYITTELPQGIYFYCLENGGKRDHFGKLIIMR